MNQSTVEVSVVMSVYNGSHYLREAIESILNQTFNNFEFIIIDDCSTDNTWEIITEYAHQDQRVVLIQNQENLGLTKSLNRGIEASKGKYIARQDADDVSLPERLEKQVLYMESHPSVALLSTGVQYIDDTGQKLSNYIPPEDPTVLRWQFLFKNPLRHSTVIWCRELVETKVGKYDPHFTCSQDYDLWTRISECLIVETLPLILVKMRRHNKSISLNKVKIQDDLCAEVTHRQVVRYFPNKKLLEQDILNLRVMPQQSGTLQPKFFADLNYSDFKQGLYNYLHLLHSFYINNSLSTKPHSLKAWHQDVEKGIINLLKHCLKRKWLIIGCEIILVYLKTFPDRTLTIAYSILQNLASKNWYLTYQDLRMVKQ